MEIVFDIETKDLQRHLWMGAVTVWTEVEKQGREAEAMGLIEDLADILGRTPTIAEVNEFIWFELDEMMDLYNEGTEEED